MRPAIVIGLGGTGQWVLTFLKRELIEANAGEMPRAVRLLCFDTASQNTIRTSLGSIRLEADRELFTLRGDLGDLVREIADGRHAHLQWFAGKSLLSRLPRAAFSLSEGAGLNRQIGRLSLFYDLSNPMQSGILNAIRQATQEVRAEVSERNRFECIVVGSLYGGTGAGILIDIAHLVRTQASLLGLNQPMIRGFFVLPSAHVQGDTRLAFATCFATWRELDRFTVMSEDFGSVQINYHQNDRSYQTKVKSRPYDVTYLIDPRRPSRSLDAFPPQEGVFPELANIVAFMLDDRAGSAISELITVNLAGKRSSLPRQAYHSAIGNFTIKVPEYRARRRFTYQFAKELMGTFLGIEVDRYGRVGVSDRKNHEVPQGSDARREALAFLNSRGLNVGYQEVPNTVLPHLIAAFHESRKDPKAISQLARSNIASRSTGLLEAFLDIAQDEYGNRLALEIAEVIDQRLQDHAPTSRALGDRPAEAVQRLREQVLRFREEYYGNEDLSGVRGGIYGDALGRVTRVQVARYHRFLGAWLSIALNGESPDPYISLTGKIGYARAFLASLVDLLGGSLEFLDRVREERRKILLTTEASKVRTEAWETYRRKADARILFGLVDAPEAYRLQEAYLQAEQYDIQVRQNELLLHALVDTVLALRSVTDQLYIEVNGWIECLATGAPPAPGLYGTLMYSGEAFEGESEHTEVLSRIIPVDDYTIDADSIGDALKRLSWNVAIDQESIRLHCLIGFDEDSAPVRLLGRNELEAVETNLRILLQMAAYYCARIERDKPVAHEIMTHYPSPTALAVEFGDLASPPYLPTHPLLFGPQEISCFVGIRSIDAHTAEYLELFLDEFRARDLSRIVAVDLEDPHKFVLMRSDDLLISEDYEIWHRCRDAYLNLVNLVADPRQGIPGSELHIFPAEINACRYEAEISKRLGREYRPIQPQIVALLENGEQFEMFFRCYALNLIRYADEEESWIYQTLGVAKGIYLNDPRSFVSRNNDSILQIINNFVNVGRDMRRGYRDSLLIDWNDARKAIFDVQRSWGVAKAATAYREQITHGIVRNLRTEVEHLRGKEQNPYRRQIIARELEDLADLAEIIYLESIKSLEGRGVLIGGDEIRYEYERRYLKTVGFEIVEAETDEILIITPAPKIWAARLKKPLLAMMLLNQTVDSAAIIRAKTFRDQIVTKSKIPTQFEDIVLVFVENALEDSAWMQIATFRTDGLKIIPITQDLVQTGLIEQNTDKARDELKTVLKQYLGKEDLYDRRTPVTDKVHFYGRETVCESIMSRLVNGQPVGVFGLRKVGKSSLLQYLREHATSPVAYINLQGLQPKDDKGRLILKTMYESILQSWHEAILTKAKGFAWHLPELREGNISKQFIETVEHLYGRLADYYGEERRLGIFLDEIELIVPKQDAEDVGAFLDFGRTIRWLIEAKSYIALVIAGVDTTIIEINRWGIEQNPFNQLTQEEYLGSLSMEQCAQMIRNIGRMMGIEYEQDAVDYVMAASGGHPFLARQLCSLILKSSDGASVITSNVVESAITQFIRNATTRATLDDKNGIWWECTRPEVWKQELSVENETILKLLAEHSELLERRLLEVNNLAVREDSVHRLAQRYVLRILNEVVKIRFGLFENWIKKYKLEIDDEA